MSKSLTAQQNKLVDLPLVLSEKAWDVILNPEPDTEGFSRLRMLIDDVYHELLRCPTATQWSLLILSQEPCFGRELPDEIDLLLRVESHEGEPCYLSVLLPEEA